MKTGKPYKLTGPPEAAEELAPCSIIYYPLAEPKCWFGKSPKSGYFLLGWLLIACSLLATSRARAQSKETTIRRIHPDTVMAWLTKSQLPAVGIGIIEKGSLQEVKVYGQQRNIPLPANAIFNVASLTKPVVAQLTLLLVNRKQWKLDEPLAKYWVDPEVKENPWHQKLTTRHILSQQSGFPNWRWNHPSKKLSFDFTPGTKYGYSGEGFEYLKHALEAKFGKSLEQLADSLLFRPFAMHDTRFYRNGTVDTARFADEHDANGNRYKIPIRTEASAADDLLTTVEDYSKFCVAVLNGTGLSRQIYEEMISPQTLVDANKDLHWGLGWEVIKNLSPGEYALFHAGSDRGVRTAVILLPQSRRGLIVFTNGDQGGAVIRKIAAESINVGKEIVERLK